MEKRLERGFHEGRGEDTAGERRGDAPNDIVPGPVVVVVVVPPTGRRRQADGGRGAQRGAPPPGEDPRRGARRRLPISSGVVASTRSWTPRRRTRGRSVRPKPGPPPGRRTASAASATEGRPMSSMAPPRWRRWRGGGGDFGSADRRGDERSSGIRASSFSSVSPRRSSMISQRTAARRGIFLLTRGPTRCRRAPQRHDILVYSDLLRLGTFTAAARRATPSPLARARVRVLPPLRVSGPRAFTF